MSLFSYFKACGFPEKSIVFLLIIFSLIAWSIMIGKYLDLRSMRLKNYEFANKLDDKGILTKQENLISCAYFNLFEIAYSAYKRHNEIIPNDPKIIDTIANAIQRKLSEEILGYESKMIFLGAIVSGAPFLGLLGTIWGIMTAFGSVALQNSASIQVLAPGIAGSLLTTIAGLLVAIPSIFGYNFLLTQSKLMTTELENFASILTDRIAIEINL